MFSLINTKPLWPMGLSNLKGVGLLYTHFVLAGITCIQGIIITFKSFSVTLCLMYFNSPSTIMYLQKCIEHRSCVRHG